LPLALTEFVYEPAVFERFVFEPPYDPP